MIRGILFHNEVSWSNILQEVASDAVIAYSDAIRTSARQAKIEVPIDEGVSQRVMTFDAEIEKVQLLNEQDQPVTTLASGQVARVVVDARMNKDVQKPIFSMTIRTPNGQTIYDTTTRWMDIHTPDFVAGDRCRIEFELTMYLLNGEFELGVDIAASDFSHLYDSLERALGFTVVSSHGAKGLTDLGAKFRISRSALMETRYGATSV